MMSVIVRRPQRVTHIMGMEYIVEPFMPDHPSYQIQDNIVYVYGVKKGTVVEIIEDEDFRVANQRLIEYQTISIVMNS